MKKKELFLILGALILAFALFSVAKLMDTGKAAAGVVRIYVDGKLHQEEKLGLEREIEITQKTGEKNILHLTPDGFYMAYSTCHNQLCIGQGQVTLDNYFNRSLGTHVLCLPNRVDVELVLLDRTPVPDLPDI